MIAVAVLVTSVAVHTTKVRVDDSLLRRDATSRVIHQKSIEEIETNLIEVCDNVRDICSIPLGERGLEVGERGDARPVLLAGCSEDAIER